MNTTSRALAFANRWFDAATVQRVFEPLIADWQREWQDASGLRRWSVHLRAFTAFCCATVLSSHRILRQPTPASVSNRIVVRICRFVLVITALQTLGWRWQSDFSALLLLLLVPSNLVVAFPFAMIAAVDAIRRDHALPPHTERAAVAKLAIAAMVFMIVFGGFVVPEANQAFRTASYKQVLLRADPDSAARAARYGRGEPRRGLRELNTYELLTDHGFTDGSRFLPEHVNRELSLRAALMVLPLVLLWLRWSLLDRPTGRWTPLPPTVVAVAAFVVFGMVWQRTVLGPWPSLMIVSVLLGLDAWLRARKRVLA